MGSQVHFRTSLELITENYDYEPENQQKAYILVAEDYEPNQDVAKMHLTTAGHMVDFAADGKEAVAMSEIKHYDMIFMDIQMPEMDGYTATRLIRSGDSPCCNIPIIGLTANAESGTQQGCLDAGMNDVVTKPIRRKHLCNVVNKWLGEPDENPQAISNNDTKQIDEAPFNFEQAVDEFGGNRDLVATVMDKFISNVELQFQIFKDAMEKQDIDTIRKEAHKIRGGAANLTASQLSVAAENLEKCAASGKLNDIAENLAELKNQFERLKSFV